MKASIYNLTLTSRGRFIVMNGLSGIAATLDLPTLTCLRRDPPGQMEQSVSAALSKAGILVVANRDEHAALKAAARHRHEAERHADLSLVLESPEIAPKPDHPAIEPALRAASAFAADPRVEQIKFRLITGPEWSIEGRARLLRYLRRRLAALGISNPLLLVTARLTESPFLSALEADAFMFHWDLHRAPPPTEEQIAALDKLACTHAVAVTLTCLEQSDLERNRSALVYAAAQPRLASSAVVWGLEGEENGDFPWYLPTVCRGNGNDPALHTMRETIPLPIRPVFAPVALHPGCPLRGRWSAFFVGGQALSCLLRSSARDRELKPLQPSRLAPDLFPLSANALAHPCAPFYAAECPRRDIPEDEHAVRSEALSLELRRLLQRGQLPLINPRRSE